MSKRIMKDKVLHVETITTANSAGMNVVKKTTSKILLAQEPAYIKLYLNTLLTFKDLPKQLSPLLFELLHLMTYANKESKYGGQLILITMVVKEEIIERLGISMSTFKNNLTALTKSGILKRIGNSTYQANLEMFGRGEWEDIKDIRATFHFKAGKVTADIETNE